MGADRADRQRAVADRLELAALAEIDRDGDDLGAMRPLSQGMAAEVSAAAGIGEHDCDS